MEKLTDCLDKVVIDITVRNMLNPNNKDFYIPNITLEKLESLVGEDEYASQIFWSAFAIASAEYRAVAHPYLPHLQYSEHTIFDGCCLECGCTTHFTDYIDTLDCCPECGCTSYLFGLCCPNCDHYED